MNALIRFIAKTGQNPSFVAFMAHAGFSYFVVSLFSGGHQVIAAVVCIGLFAMKEYLFDQRYETIPPQTFYGDTEDYAGYLVGIAMALTVAHYHW